MFFKKLDKNANCLEKRRGDCGYDLTAVSVNNTDLYVEYGTGIAVEIPEGFVGLLFPRSSVSKYGLVLANCVGVIDQNYRGEIKARFKKVGNGPEYQVGDKVAQLLIMPVAEPEWVEVYSLSDTNRGSGGFGSTGN